MERYLRREDGNSASTECLARGDGCGEKKNAAITRLDRGSTA
jgi:hypothetical protein